MSIQFLTFAAMQEAKKFYKGQLETHNSALSQLKTKLLWSSMLRLAVFIVGAYVVYASYPNTQAILLSIFVIIAVFLFLVSRHSNLQAKRDKLRQLVALNEIELEVLNRNYSKLPNGSEYIDPAHHYSHDIDLFGPQSFFQYLNRAALTEGARKLAVYLKANETHRISIKQEAIKELAEKPEWRQNFSATASLVKTEITTQTVKTWLANYKPAIPKLFTWLPFVFSGISITLIALYFFDLVSVYLVGFWFFVGLAITGLFVKKVNLLSSHTSKIQGLFEQYYQLIQQIEATEFSSEFLKEQKAKIVTEKEQASLVLSRFSKLLSALDQRNNMLFGIFGNGFLQWDNFQSYKIEQWIKAHKHQVSDWFEVVAVFDAYNSLGNFSFNHKEFTFPKITEQPSVFNVEDAAHPLMASEVAVKNSFHIENGHFFIITGANMAGKSTFLRTVSLMVVMANCGLPVCAKTCTYNPIKLITSMRTTDSLSDDASYFFSELKRLKFIVDEIAKDDYFIILDEILKGTNSTDKAIGSKKFIEKLNGTNSTGIIATHDLSLCEVANNLPEVHNYYFDAEIIDNELHFDYTLKNGICQNMNASFLLKKMQIIDS